MDGNRILFVTLPDELTTPDDTRLNAGIAMLHFAGCDGKPSQFRERLDHGGS